MAAVFVVQLCRLGSAPEMKDANLPTKWRFFLTHFPLFACLSLFAD